MTTTKWKINEKGIINSMDAVLKSGDITKLTKDCYNFTMNVSGFIAHYNHQGFMSTYENTAELLADLERSSDIARPEYYLESFFQKDQAEYYTAKSRILKAYADMVKKYKNKTIEKETDTIEDKWELLKEITSRGYTTDEKRNILKKLGLM